MPHYAALCHTKRRDCTLSALRHDMRHSAGLYRTMPHYGALCHVCGAVELSTPTDETPAAHFRAAYGVGQDGQKKMSFTFRVFPLCLCSAGRFHLFIFSSILMLIFILFIFAKKPFQKTFLQNQFRFPRTVFHNSLSGTDVLGKLLF